MNINRAIETIFSTRNYDRILAKYNGLSLSDKQIFLSNNKIKQRINKIADVNLLFHLLIDIPYDSRIKFLNGINKEKYMGYSEKVLFDFLRLENYEDFDCYNLSFLKEIKEKKLISLMFKKFSVDKLKGIINSDYCLFINDYAFVEYSKKSTNLKIEAELLNNVSDSVLFGELRKRTLNDNISTFINFDEFLKLGENKRQYVFSSGIFNSSESELLMMYQCRVSNSSKEELMNRATEIMQNLNCINLLELQVIIYNMDEEEAKELMKLVFKNVCKFEFNIEDRYLYLMIYNFRKLNIKTKELYNVLKMKPFAVINYLNTGNIDNSIDKLLSKNITVCQYQKTNNKKINKIVKLLNILKNDGDSSLRNIDTFTLAFKLYYIFGYENSIELLNGKFGKFNLKLLVKMFNECNIKEIEFKKVNNNFEPIVNEDFIRFLIGDKKDNNTAIKRILRGELELIVNNFSYIFNNFKMFQQKIGKKIHLNKLMALLTKDVLDLSPNEYKLTNDIIDNIVKSASNSFIITGNIDANEKKKIIMDACSFYHMYLDKRIVSSIPRVWGVTDSDYRYEVLKLDDPVIMTLGYQTGCCFRMNGFSNNFLRYCSESVYARVIVIKNEINEICGMIPIIRNGNVIVGNSIESNSKGDALKIINALEKCFDDIIKTSNDCEEKPIIAGCVTNLWFKEYLANKKNVRNIFPISDECFYTNYNSEQHIISILDGKNEENFELYTPEAIYFDERPEVLVYHYRMKDTNLCEEVKKRVKAILYNLGRNLEFFYLPSYVICSEDWYLTIEFNKINGECLNKDPRAIHEFNAVKKYLEDKFANERIYDFQSVVDNLSYDEYESLLSKKRLIK